jgi:4-aminobutyrate aminotransferase-like enzyme/Ser/Thr protein kinase RdoA (MazF antagonist)
MSAIDDVLLAPRPAWSPDDVAATARRLFGLTGATGAVELGSERDQAFRVHDDAGRAVAIVKVSNAAEDPATLDMEARAAFLVAERAGEVPVALPLAAAGSADSGGLDDLARFRPSATGPDGESTLFRAYAVAPGRSGVDPSRFDDRTLAGWGSTAARVARALRGFVHPRALRVLPWDVAHAHRARGLVDHIADPDEAALVEATLDRFESVVLPRLGGLRSQVIHGDLTVDNVLAADDGTITGVVDFGDMSHSTLVADLASLLASVTAGRRGGELFRAARIVLDGYRRITPLEDDELDLVVDAWMARNAAGVAIISWRVGTGLEEPAYTAGFRAEAVAQLREAAVVEPDPAARSALARGPRRPTAPGADLAARRYRVFGNAIEPLSYRRPVHPVRAEGCWMFDADGTRLLDAYNNVPSVGHAHPRVVEAIERQARLVNTNMRYLHETGVELAERLVALCPPGLDTVLYVNSGTEANDLAWRIATSSTGNRGGLCTSFAYHGISPTMALFSPETLKADADRDFVAHWDPPDSMRGLHTDVDGFADAVDGLDGRGLGLAATILDGVLQSDGVQVPEPAYVQQLVAMTHEAGGLWIADEVQGGHGRTGAMWSFERFGIEPDIVTLGKPMGNGHPVAAVICRHELLERLAADTVFFSTFGGNPVSAAAAMAVLDVIEDERVLERTAAAGVALRAALGEIDDPRIGHVRGVGLAVGVEIVDESGAHDPAEASRLKERLRELGVLVGTTGPKVNVLKVRPPLAFTTAEVPVFVDALRAALDR